MRHNAATPSAPPSSTRWARVFSLVYDPALAVAEWAGMRGRRRELLSRARGRTLEIGSGTGLNLGLYPDGLHELILAEPDSAMRKRLAKRVRRKDRAVRVLDASAERLPLPDDSIDTVVSTLVLCTVDDPDRAMREIVRVLRPDGQLLFIEHVRADTARLARWQDRLAGPWLRFAVGCRCNRPTVALMEAAGLEPDVRRASWRGMPRIVRPLVVGRASKQQQQASLA